MGSGGSFEPRGLKNVKSLIEEAKKELKKGEKESRHNVFISFAYEDIDNMNLLRGQAKNDKSPIEFNDWSVSEPIESERAVYIKQKITERISQSSLTVVYLSTAAVASKWVEWEVEQSLKLGKKVIGVFKGDVRPSPLPDAIRKNKIKCVPWSKLAETIKNL